MDFTRADFREFKQETLSEIRGVMGEYGTRKEVQGMLKACTQHRDKDLKLINHYIKNIRTEQEKTNEHLKEMNGSRKKHEARITAIEQLHEKQAFLAEQMERVEEKTDKRKRRKHHSWQIKAAQIASLAALISIFIFILELIKDAIT